MSRFKGGRSVDFDGKDKFYTKDNVAKHVVRVTKSLFPFRRYDNIIEPSAGSGAILQYLPKKKRIGLDIEPQDNIEILPIDFFDYKFPNGKTLVIGNPPFGRNSKLAVGFFNQCAMYADTIAFIVPITWRFSKVQNRLDPRFKLVHEEMIDPFSFIKIGKSPGKRQLEDGSININCVFQIWTTRDNKGENIRKYAPLKSTHNDFDMCGYFTPRKSLLTDDCDWEFLIKAWGGYPFAKSGPSKFSFGAIHDTAEGLKSNWHMQYTGIVPKKKYVRDIFNSIPIEDWWVNVSSMNTITSELLVFMYEKYKTKWLEQEKKTLSQT